MTNFPDSVTVEVTAEDIAKGEYGNPFRCAVAHALSRTLDADVGVTGVDAYAYDSERHDGVLAVYLVSDEAREFILSFDVDPKSVEPTTFTLTKDPNSFALGN